ncbi:uncharacterized protein LOC111116514 [Crassostrea virginica]
MRTQPIGTNSPNQTVWWKVDLCGVYTIYSVNILFKTYHGHEQRQRGRFAGFSLYVSDTGDIDGAFLCYKDGPELPLLNFSTTCITSGRYVIFFNERQDGVAYPAGYEVTANVLMELCEVVVNGCTRPDVYGINCDIPCPINCKYSTCHILNGTCFGCKPGWTGTNCNTSCRGGWFGQDCKQQCAGHCLHNVSCNHLTGQCDRGCAYEWFGQYCNETCIGHCKETASCNNVTGLCEGGCAAGWTGYKCDEACNDGTFGIDCLNNCSGQCLHGVPCNKQTGLCDRGCNPGYTNIFCNENCNDNYFGYNCINKCSGHCLNDAPCNKQTGHCDRGCNPGFKNYFCNDSCVLSYGEDCLYPCSVHCVNQTCNRFNGRCVFGCHDGFSGDQCYQGSQINYQNEDNCAWTLGFTISLGFNALTLIIMSVLLGRKLYRLTHPGDTFPF